MADQRIQYTEEMVGNGHPTKADTLNRHAAVEHDTDGTHQKAISHLTASQAVFTDGSKKLVSNAITGTGNVVMSTSPTLVTPALGTPASGTLTNCTGYPSASTTVTGISELATTNETITGTDTARTTTPAGVAGAMAVVDNPKAMAQAVHLTAVASGSSGISVSNDTNINNGLNNFSLSCWVSLPNWAVETFFFSKYQGDADYWYFGISSAGKLVYRHAITAGTTVSLTASSALSLTSNTWHHVVAVITRESASVAGSAAIYVEGKLFETLTIPTGTPADITNTGAMKIMGLTTQRYAGDISAVTIYNRALTAAEVLDLYRNGIAFADKWGSQTEQTSGTLTVGKRYRINNWITGDDFTNIGGTNEDGNEFVATGTTPTKWTNSSTVVPAGVTLALEPEGIQPAPGQWLDSSTNKLHAMQPASGSSLVRPKREFEVRWTNTWAGTHEAQYIGGVNQAVLPANCYIESIIGVISGSTIEDIIIGDGSDTDRWVAATTGLSAGTTSFTLANRISDGTNYKLVVDPDANFTGSIAWTIKGIILQ